jgi:hypothetical protein
LPLKAALAALDARNTFAVEDIINPRQGESRIDALRRYTAEVRRERGLPPLDICREPLRPAADPPASPPAE